MKKLLIAILVLALGIAMFSGCGKKGEEAGGTTVGTEVSNGDNSATGEEKNGENNSESADSGISEGAVKPLPNTVNLDKLTDCVLDISLEKGDVFVDDDGKTYLNTTVHIYDLYDMVDIANLKEGDIIYRKGENVKVVALERLETGIVRINNGEEYGGFDLMADGNTVYYESGFNDAKAYKMLGTVPIPISSSFAYLDESDMDAESKKYYARDFLNENPDIVYNFTPHNTRIRVANGEVVEMHKRYIP